MILSASRRTDIPNYFSEWFFNRLEEGFVYVRNPMNVHQVSKIVLSPEVIDCIVFWTKNPEPMIGNLDRLRGIPCYFQFTLTGYGRDIEENIPDKKEKIIPVFQKLSDTLGSHRVIWRYDPVFFNTKYTEKYHLRIFEQIADSLKGYTKRCVISFVDFYEKNKRNMNSIHPCIPEKRALEEFAGRLAKIAYKNKMEISACAESMDLSKCGIARSCCIDKELIEEIIGCELHAEKDRNQRKECGCIESVDIGCYNTCRNGCKYCYASYSVESVDRSCRNYYLDSPLLCSTLQEGDKVTERKVKSQKEMQMRLKFSEELETNFPK